MERARYMDGTSSPEDIEHARRIERGEPTSGDLAQELNNIDAQFKRLHLAQELQHKWLEDHPDQEQLFRTDEVFRNSLLHIFNRGAEVAHSSAKRLIDVADARLIDHEGETIPPTEKITILTTLGAEKTVEIPYFDEDKIAQMRRVLLQIEATREPNGGDANREALNELYGVIIALKRKPTEALPHGLSEGKSMEKQKRNLALAELGNRMHKELVARLTLHAVFQQFDTAPNMDTVAGAVSTLTADHFNYFFIDAGVEDKTRNKEWMSVWEAFKLYEQYSDEYLSKNGPDLERFNDDIAGQINQYHGSEHSEQLEGEDKETYEYREKVLSPLRRTVTAKSAQLIAERLWQITARRVIQDKLVNTTTKIEATGEEKKAGNSDFRGEASGGNFALRRALCFNEWLYTRVKKDRVLPELAKGIDLQTPDFLSTLPGKIEGYYKDILLERYKQGGLGPLQAAEKAKKDARRIAEAFVGQTKVVKDKNKPEGEDNLKWLSGQQFDATKILWRGVDENGNIPPILQEFFGKGKIFSEDERKIDMKIFKAASPMGYLAFAVWGAAEKARDALTAKTDVFLRMPSEENLKAITDLFSYQSEGAFETKAKLIGNLVGFLASPDASKINAYKLNIAEADARIFALAQSMGLNREDALKISKETLGDSGWDNLRIFIGHFGADKAILAFIMEIIAGILQQGLSFKQ